MQETEVYSEPRKTPKVDLFAKILNNFQPLLLFREAPSKTTCSYYVTYRFFRVNPHSIVA